jgi:hypothetical protein
MVAKEKINGITEETIDSRILTYVAVGLTSLQVSPIAAQLKSKKGA